MQFADLRQEFKNIEQRGIGDPTLDSNAPISGLGYSKRSIAPHPGFQEAYILSEQMNYHKKSIEHTTPPQPSFKLPDELIFDNLSAFLGRQPSYLRMEDLEHAKEIALQALSREAIGVSLALMQMSQDTLNIIIDTGYSFKADRFLNTLLLKLIHMKHLHVNTPHSSIEDRVSRMAYRAFQKRSSPSYIAAATAAEKSGAADPNLLLLKRECKRSVIDVIFKIRMRKAVSLVQEHTKPRMDKKKRKPKTMYPQEAWWQEDVYQQNEAFYQDAQLQCRIQPVPQPRELPKVPAVGGFWTLES